MVVRLNKKLATWSGRDLKWRSGDDWTRFVLNGTLNLDPTIHKLSTQFTLDGPPGKALAAAQLIYPDINVVEAPQWSPQPEVPGQVA